MARILVVEDDETIRNYLDIALGGYGHQTTAVGTLAAARDVLESFRYDAIVVDVTLPDGTGITLAAEATTRGCRPVLITGNPGAIGNLLDRNIPYLQKPFEIADLLSALSLPT